jgi:hypothetical protein
MVHIGMFPHHTTTSCGFESPRVTGKAAASSTGAMRIVIHVEQVPRYGVVWISIHTSKRHTSTLQAQSNATCFSRGTSSTLRRSVDFNPHEQSAYDCAPTTQQRECFPRGTHSMRRSSWRCESTSTWSTAFPTSSHVGEGRVPSTNRAPAQHDPVSRPVLSAVWGAGELTPLW